MVRFKGILPELNWSWRHKFYWFYSSVVFIFVLIRAPARHAVESLVHKSIRGQGPRPLRGSTSNGEVLSVKSWTGPPAMERLLCDMAASSVLGHFNCRQTSLFIALNFIVLHRCFVFLQIEVKTLHQHHNHDSHCCDAALSRWSGATPAICPRCGTPVLGKSFLCWDLLLCKVLPLVLCNDADGEGSFHWVLTVGQVLCLGLDVSSHLILAKLFQGKQ